KVEWELDFPKVSKRVFWMARDLDDTRPAAALEATGAKLIRGAGKVVDLRTVEVEGGQYVATKALVIANGGTAAIPPIPGLDQVEYWTNRQAAIPREHPATLVVLGGGAVGVELAQAFARLGSKVTVIVARRLRGEDARADHTAVPRVTYTDPEVASVGLSEQAARERGIEVVTAFTDPAEAARGYIHDFKGGAVKLVGDRKKGVLVGA